MAGAASAAASITANASEVRMRGPYTAPRDDVSRRARSHPPSGSARAEADDAGLGEPVEPLADLGERRRGVATREHVADIADRALAVDEVQRLEGQHAIALLERC